ncbi:unnamed protein product [Clavelina lepadiformis]|uniref:CUB domain-containing protein n=2 Tax=Clavelina lepadiformis TaxID=159417 RepID=A0ABP0GIW9_CLALP
MGFVAVLLTIAIQLIQNRVLSTSSVVLDLQISAENSSTFSTPGYPLVPYSNDASYEWRIQAPDGLRILITFIAGRTEGCCDRVQVIDGGDIIGKFSGKIIPGTSRLSKGNSLHVTFSSDEAISFAGFEAKLATATCGGNIEVVDDNALELTSDGWPNAYGNNEKCFWVLYGRERKQIQLDLIEGSTEPDNDHIEIFNGLSIIARRSGDITMESFIADSGILILSFHSNDQEVEQGFRSAYKKAKCGFNATASDTPTILSTPFYPSLYPDDLSCEWNMNAAADKLIELTFMETDTEDCCDFIQITYDSDETRQLSGKIPAGLVFTSTNNNLRLSFNSDYRGSGPGFRAVLREVDPTSSCVYSEFVGETPKNISSPLYPYIYHNNMSCQWILQANDQHIIRIDFLEVKTQDCCDIIRIRESGQRDFTLSGDTSFVWTSKNNYVEVIFSSDSSVVNKGFLATVQSEEPVCQSQINIFANSTTGYFSSPLYPTFYSSGVTCVWNLMTGWGKKVVITFLEGILQGNTYIRVYDRSGPVLRLSGTIIPGTSRISTYDFLVINFVTDHSGSAAGFRASYHDANYGQNYEVSKAPMILSPPFGFLDCFWILYATEKNQVYFESLQGNYLLSGDYVEIFDGTTLLAKMSGLTVTKVIFTSTTGFLKVHFHGNYLVSGIKVKYRYRLQRSK